MANRMDFRLLNQNKTLASKLQFYCPRITRHFFREIHGLNPSPGFIYVCLGFAVAF